ncbi:MAG: glycosyltransferase, partial [Armatimonadota bacterium]|nr:glycosyltransferase [Armatimonadota bacterium]
MLDLIFVSMENWDEVWRRNQFLCATLARRYPALKILFVGLPRNVAHHIRNGKFADLFRPATWRLADYPGITVTRSLRVCPESIPGGRKFNEWFSRWQIHRVARGVGIKSPVLWLNPHYAVHMAGRMGERAVIYDITDDWALAKFSSGREDINLIRMQDRELCQKADLVIVCSEALEGSRRPLAKRILLLPNGVDSAHYQSVSIRPAEQRWPGPVFGYTGTLHDDRTDVEIVLALARAFPHGSVVLVGPDMLEAAASRLLEPQKNVYRTGSVPYSEIPRYMASFDVCIVPHVETPFTDSLNPIKLWEYLASGKPVVSTNVAGFRSYSDLCSIASGPEAFVQACQKAVDEKNNPGRAARMEVASRNGWESRVDRLLEEVREIG